MEHDGTLVWYERGQGGIGQAVGSGFGGITYLAQIDDLTGDGQRDVLARGADNNLYLYPGSFSGQLGPAKQIGSKWSSMDFIVPVGSLDGSANQYIVARNRYNGNLYRYTLNANGLAAGVQIGSKWGNMAHLLSVGDFSKDGRSDLLAIDKQGRLWRYLGTPAGYIGEGAQVGTVGPRSTSPSRPAT